MRTALSRRHGWTLAVLLVAAIVTIATVRLSASDAKAPTHVTAQLAHRPRTARHPTLRVPHAGRLIRTLTGTGSGSIGSLRERRAVVLQWHTSGGPFQIYTSRGMILVSGRGHRGSIGLTRGNYTNLRVSTPGAWTIRLSRQR